MIRFILRIIDRLRVRLNLYPRRVRRIVPTLSALVLLTSLQNAGAQEPAHPKADPGVARDKNGNIERSSTAREQFERQTGYPHGRPGYVIDHIVPLAKGGKDTPSNMQWQTEAEAKAKDRIELGQKTKAATGSSVQRGGFGASARSANA